MSVLFSPFDLAGLKLANRVVVSPMCQYSARGGQATDWHLIHLGHLALSDAGLLIVEATAVEAEGRISAGDLGIYDDTCEAALGRVLAAVRQHSSTPMALQLAHAGRKASTDLPWKGGDPILPEAGGWRPWAPSALVYDDMSAVPHALNQAGLRRVR